MKIMKSIIIFCVLIGAFSFPSYAAVTIKDTTDKLTGLSISDCYLSAMNMNEEGQGLESTMVDVHMANNREWATVSYLSNSIYGTSCEGKNTGISIETDVTTHYSTNGNITGVMDWGNLYTYTAGVIKNTSAITKEDVVRNGNAILININQDLNIDAIEVETKKIEYLYGKTGWYSAMNGADGWNNYPFSFRKGLFGFGISVNWDHLSGNGYRGCGAAYADITFRPVFYNH